MSEELRLDTGLLRNHVSVVMDEKRTALQLYSTLNTAKRLSSPDMQSRFNGLLSQIENLAAYFGEMATSLDSICDEAIELKRQLDKLIEDDSDAARKLLPDIIL